MGTFGQRLKELRNDRGISQNELSKHIGVSKSSVNMYERGEREPGFETLDAIADFFNVNMDYLLGREPRIMTNISSQEIAIIAQIEEKQFSASAQPTLIKFVAAINTPDAPDFSEYLAKVRLEMDRTFTPDDFERLTTILEAINSAYNRALSSITQALDSIIPEGPQPISDKAASAADVLVTPQKSQRKEPRP